MVYTCSLSTGCIHIDKEALNMGLVPIQNNIIYSLWLLLHGASTIELPNNQLPYSSPIGTEDQYRRPDWSHHKTAAVHHHCNRPRWHIDQFGSCPFLQARTLYEDWEYFRSLSGREGISHNTTGKYGWSKYLDYRLPEGHRTESTRSRHHHE